MTGLSPSFASSGLTRAAAWVRISFLCRASIPLHVQDSFCLAPPPSAGSWAVSLCARRGSCLREHTRVCRTHGGVCPASPAGPSEALPPADRPVLFWSPTRQRQELAHNLPGGAGGHCLGCGLWGPVTAAASRAGAQLFLWKALPHTVLLPHGQGLRLPESPRCPQPPGRSPATNRSSEQRPRVDQTRACGPGATPGSPGLCPALVRTSSHLSPAAHAAAHAVQPGRQFSPGAKV